MVRKPNAFGWGGEKQNPQPPLTNLGRPFNTQRVQSGEWTLLIPHPRSGGLGI